jgi:hypothetical protein
LQAADTFLAGIRSATAISRKLVGWLGRGCSVWVLHVLTKSFAMLLCGVALLSQTTLGAAQSNMKTPVHPPVEQQVRVPQRMFISGHSLTNEPLPSDLAAIAFSLGFQVSWNRQHLEGSSIKQRSRGDASDDAPWTGYSQGVDYANRLIDVLTEFRRPAGHPDQPYDTLLITEQHSLLGSLVWNDTVRHLRDFHDRFIERSPNGLTYFYESWLSLDSKDDPKRWIAYERAAAPVWRCIVEQTNVAIVADGRQDRIRSLPAGLALAGLIERATQGAGLPYITRESVRSTVDSLVADDVHLTRLGNYYMALFTFAYMFRRSPKGAWHPADVTAEQARALQEVAGTVAALPQPQTMPIFACRDYVRRSFLWTYLGYTDATHWRRERGFLGSLYFRFKLAVQWLWLFSSDKPDNPFADAAYRRLRRPPI